MNPKHPLYYHCYHDTKHERYGLFQQSTNSFYIIDNDPKLLKKIQLLLQKYEFFHLVNIDHFYTFLSKMQDLLDDYKIEELNKNHISIVRNAAIYTNDQTKIEQIQKIINNDNCYLFGLTVSSARSLPLDMTHYRLSDNIIKHDKISERFDNVIQEKLFLLRGLTYVLKSSSDYMTRFVTLQEKISNLGLEVSEEFYQTCYPEDKNIKMLIEKERVVDDIRFNSILEYKKILYKILNQLDYQKPVEELLINFLSSLENSQEILIEEKSQFAQRSFEVNRIEQVLRDFAKNILKRYEYYNRTSK